MEGPADYTTWNAAVNHTYFLSPRLVNSAQFTFAESNFQVGGLPLEGPAAGVTERMTPASTTTSVNARETLL